MNASSPDAHTASVQVFDGPKRPFRSERWPLPERLGAGQVLVAIELATICGSDLHTCLGRRNQSVPAILGHEAVGRVVATGSGRDLEAGARITWSIADSCGTCPACTRDHLPQKCHRLFKYGHADTSDGTGLNGCYASHILLREGTHIVPVPDEIPNEVIAPANCALATMINAVSHLPENCRSVVIQGAGLLGLYGCALLQERGIQTVYCVDVNPARLRRIPEFGGIPINGRDPDYLQTIVTETGHGVDAVVETAGTVEVVPDGFDLLRTGGTYVLVGLVHPRSQLDVTAERIIRQCLTIHGIHNYAPAHLDEAVMFLLRSRGSYPFETLLSKPYPLEKLQEAVAEADTGTWHRVALRP